MIRSPYGPGAVAVPHGAMVLTAQAGAAAALGVPHLSPAQYAARLHGRAGGVIAGRLRRWRTLAAVVAEDAAGSADPTGLQRALTGPVRELLRVGLDGVPDDAGVSRRAAAALRVARRYRERLDGEGEVDPAEIFWAATASCERLGAPREPLALFGARRLGPDECAFLSRVAGDGSVVVVGPEDERTVRRLARLGWSVRDAAAPASPVAVGEAAAAAFLAPASPGRADATGAVAYRFASQEEEIRWVLGRVKALLSEGVPAGDVVLAARDDAALSGPLRAVAWEFDVPVRCLHEVPLADTRLGGWTSDLREVLVRGLPHEETARLLAHRLGGGWSDETASAARAGRPVGLEAWRALDGRVAALAWPESDDVAGWRARLDATLAAFGLADEEALPPRDAAVLRTLRAAVGEAGATVTARMTRRAFLADLEDLTNLLTVRQDPRPAEGEAAHVELRALPTLAGARVPHLFVLAAAEGELPAELRDDPVLDFFDRRRLAEAGVPVDVAADRARDEEGAFAAALRSASGHLTLTVPMRRGGRSQLPSPYLARLGATPRPAPARPPASAEERRVRALQHGTGADPADRVLAQARHAWRVERRRESALPHDAHDGATGVPVDPAATPLSATQIVELGSCPFQWFARRVLGVREPEEVGETLAPRLRGNLWHAALQHAGEEAVRALTAQGSARDLPGADPAAVRDAILTALPAAFERAEREVGVPAGPAWDKIRRGERRALERAVRADAFLSPGARPVAFERPFRGRWRGLEVRGVVDRVDEGPEGIELVDYKSGTGAPRGAQDASGWGWIDVQLPLYLEVAGPRLAGGRPLAEARYLSLRSAETVRTARPGANDEALAELAERVRRHLAQGSFPVAPDPKRTVCRTCDLAAVCRVGPRVARKRDAAAPGPADPAGDGDDARATPARGGGGR